MQIIGDRHYKASPGERITFAEGKKQSVEDITVDASSGGGDSLPITFEQGEHQTLGVTVSFTSDSGGFAIVTVDGDQGGSDTSKIRQLSEAVRSVIFVVD